MPPKKTSDSNDGLPPGIGAPATRALAGAGFTRLEQLTHATEADLLRLHGFGPKALRIIVAALGEKGWRLAAPAATREPKKARAASSSSRGKIRR